MSEQKMPYSRPDMVAQAVANFYERQARVAAMGTPWIYGSKPICPHCQSENCGRSFSREYAPISVLYFCRDCYGNMYWDEQGVVVTPVKDKPSTTTMRRWWQFWR